MSRHLQLVGVAFKTDGFNPSKPYTGCRICGKLFQSSKDLLANPTLLEIIDAFELRQLWRVKHSNSHTLLEHRKLQMSGQWCTPEAAQIFEGYGIISLSDLVMHEEHIDAMKVNKITVKEVENVVL